MICLSPIALALFIATTGLGYDITGPVITVHSQTRLAWVYRSGHMCAGGAKA